MTITPIIDGQTAAFVWHGRQAPLLIGDFNGWDSRHAQPLTLVAEQVWKVDVHIPAGAYIEYAYILDGEHQTDPTNPRRVFNGLDKYNSFFYMPPGQPTPLARRVTGHASGRLTSHALLPFPFDGPDDQDSERSRRAVLLYQPPVEKPVPLLVVYDGPDYLKNAQLITILDNMIAQGLIQPIAAALLANGGALRYLEYACNDATLEFLLQQVLPLAQEKLNLIDYKADPGAYAVMGASLGGLMAMYTGLRLPQIFGHVISQSGAFFPGMSTTSLLRHCERVPLHIWMDAGEMEELHDANQTYVQLLHQRGYPVDYHTYPSGHNYTAWRDDLPGGLMVHFGSAS